MKLEFILFICICLNLDGLGLLREGGGAYKYASLIEEKLGVSSEKENEVDCLIKGE